MFESIAKILGSAFSIWDHKEKHRYQDELMRLEVAYYEEENKPDSDRSDAVLDNLMFRLRLLGDAFSSSVGESDS